MRELWLRCHGADSPAFPGTASGGTQAQHIVFAAVGNGGSHGLRTTADFTGHFYQHIDPNIKMASLGAVGALDTPRTRQYPFSLSGYNIL
jgi:hypothetical protein